MLDGVIVLDTGTKIVERGWGWSWAGLLFALVGLFAIFLGILSLLYDEGPGSVCVSFFCATIVMGLAWMLFSQGKIVKEVPTYKEVIEDSVSMVEFYDKYEILDVQGKIYTIMEREG